MAKPFIGWYCSFLKAASDFSYQMPTYHLGEQFFAWKSQKSYLSV